MTIDRQEIIKKYQLHEDDQGSAPVQVAILTARINDLRSHFDAHKKGSSQPPWPPENGRTPASAVWITLGGQTLSDTAALIADLGLRH